MLGTKSWYESVVALTEQLSGQRYVSDPCVWVFSDADGVYGIVGTHVDDFLLTGGGSRRGPRSKGSYSKIFAGLPGKKTPRQTSATAWRKRQRTDP